MQRVDVILVQMVVSSSRYITLNQVQVVGGASSSTPGTAADYLPGNYCQLAGTLMIAGFTEKVVSQCWQYHR